MNLSLPMPTNFTPFGVGVHYFQTFWTSYPRKVAKLDAEKAYFKALKITTHEKILSGLDLYKKHKPERTEWCHAATWLNGARWLDEYESTPQVKQLSASVESIKNQKEYDRVVERLKEIPQLYDSHRDMSPAHRLEYSKLKARRDELRAILRIMV